MSQCSALSFPHSHLSDPDDKFKQESADYACYAGYKLSSSGAIEGSISCGDTVRGDFSETCDADNRAEVFSFQLPDRATVTFSTTSRVELSMSILTQEGVVVATCGDEPCETISTPTGASGFFYTLRLEMIASQEQIGDQQYTLTMTGIEQFCDSRCNRCFDRSVACPSVGNIGNLPGCSSENLEDGAACRSEDVCGHAEELHGDRQANCGSADVYIYQATGDSDTARSPATCGDRTGDGGGAISDEDCGLGYVANTEASDVRCMGSECSMTVPADKIHCCSAVSCSETENVRPNEGAMLRLDQGDDVPLPVSTVSGDVVTSLVRAALGFRCTGTAFAVCGEDTASPNIGGFTCNACSEQQHCADSNTGCLQGTGWLECSEVTDDGYHLDGGLVLMNQCTCDNGQGASGPACSNDGESQCSSCYAGYSLEDVYSICVANSCPDSSLQSIPAGARLTSSPDELQTGDDLTSYFEAVEGYICSGVPRARCSDSANVVGLTCVASAQPSESDFANSRAYRLECLSNETACTNGRVAVLDRGEWGTICDIGIDYEQAGPEICGFLGFPFGELYSHGLASYLEDLPISGATLLFRSGDQNLGACTPLMDLGAICYNESAHQATQDWTTEENCTTAAMIDEQPLYGQQIMFGCVSISTVYCPLDENIDGRSYGWGRSQYATCAGLVPSEGYCHASIRTAERLRSEDVCRCGASSDIGFHLRTSFRVLEPGQYSFRFQGKVIGAWLIIDGNSVYITSSTSSVRSISPAVNIGSGKHHLEIIGFADAESATEVLEVNLPCDSLDVWRIVRAGTTPCFQCGPVEDLSCLSSSSAIPETMLDGHFSQCDAVRAMCSADADNQPVWHGSVGQCEACNYEELQEGLCGATCTLPFDSAPSGIANSNWGVGDTPCLPGAVIRPGDNCTFSCPSGYAPYSGMTEGYGSQPFASCTPTSDEMGATLVVHGQCVPTTCVDDSTWSTSFHKTLTVLHSSVSAPSLMQEYAAQHCIAATTEGEELQATMFSDTCLQQFTA